MATTMTTNKIYTTGTTSGTGGTITISAGSGTNSATTNTTWHPVVPKLTDSERFFRSNFKALGSKRILSEKTFLAADSLWKKMLAKNIVPSNLNVDTELIRLGLAEVNNGSILYRDPEGNFTIFKYASFSTSNVTWTAPNYTFTNDNNVGIYTTGNEIYYTDGTATYQITNGGTTTNGK